MPHAADGDVEEIGIRHPVRVLRRAVVVPSQEELVQAVQVALKKVLRVGVVRADHLGKVDDCDFVRVVAHDVELVVIAVHQTALRQVHKLRDALRINAPRLFQAIPPRQRRAVDQAHQHCVPVHVHRFRHGEPVIPERFHKRVFLKRGES